MKKDFTAFEGVQKMATGRPKTFKQWLEKQRNRRDDDPIGIFARFVHDDPAFPEPEPEKEDRGVFADYIEGLRQQGATAAQVENAFKCFAAAWTRYLQQKRESEKLPVILTAQERAALLDQFSKRHAASSRNRLIIITGLNLGLRVSEITALTWADIDFLTREIKIRNGKGNKDRIVYLNEPGSVAVCGHDLFNELKEWQQRLKKEFNGALPGFVFPVLRRSNTTHEGSNLRGCHLNARNVQFMIDRYAKKAGIEKSVSPHTLRHTFATEYYRRTKNLQALKSLLGHASISTTQIYITLAGDELKKAASFEPASFEPVNGNGHGGHGEPVENDNGGAA